jgi:hypothetical protein
MKYLGVMTKHNGKTNSVMSLVVPAGQEKGVWDALKYVLDC